MGIPHIDFFLGRILSVWGDGLPVSLQDGAEDAGQFFGRMLDERAEVRKRLEDVHAKEVAKILAKHREQSFKPRDRVWVRNRIVEPPVHGKLKRVWQGPCGVLRRISTGTYRVNIRGTVGIFTSRQLEPYVAYKDDKKVPLYYYTDREGLSETYDYVVECVLEDRVVRGKRQWRVKFRGFSEPEWHYAGSFWHNINDTWGRWNRRKGIDVSLSDLR